MTTATKELGFSSDQNHPLVAGFSGSIVITLVTEADGEKRIPTKVTDSLTAIKSCVGPEKVGDNSVKYTIEIAPDVSGVVDVAVDYEDGAPSTTISFPVMGPMVISMSEYSVNLGRRRIVFDGHNLNGCRPMFKTPTNDCKIVSCKSSDKQIIAEFESRKASTYELRIAHGQQQQISIFADANGQPLKIEFTDPAKKSYLWVSIVFLIVVVSALSIAFFGSC